MNKGRWGALGIRSALPSQAVILIVIILIACIALSIWGVRFVQQRFATTTPPALSPASATGPIKVNADAEVVATRLTPLRQEPGEQGAVILLVAEGQIARVVEGPRTVENRPWWRVTVGTHTGWLPETLTDGTRVIAGK